MRAIRRLIGRLAFLLLFLAGVALLWGIARGRPQDLPWTPLDLGDPIGRATGAKLTGLSGAIGECRALLDRAGVRYTALPARHDGPRCGYGDAIRFTRGGAREIGFTPASLGIACPVAAGLAMWEWNVVQPAAQRHFGQAVTRITHFGSYSCRRIYGRDAGNWSEHAAANAIDIAGFVLTDGRSVTVVRDWRGGGDEAGFLHEVRDGACRLFATTLSPDYNAAHRDHLHLDQANRGTMGWRACR